MAGGAALAAVVTVEPEPSVHSTPLRPQVAVHAGLPRQVRVVRLDPVAVAALVEARDLFDRGQRTLGNVAILIADREDPVVGTLGVGEPVFVEAVAEMAGRRRVQGLEDAVDDRAVAVPARLPHDAQVARVHEAQVGQVVAFRQHAFVGRDRA